MEARPLAVDLGDVLSGNNQGSRPLGVILLFSLRAQGESGLNRPDSEVLVNTLTEVVAVDLAPPYTLQIPFLICSFERYLEENKGKNLRRKIK